MHLVVPVWGWIIGGLTIIGIIYTTWNQLLNRRMQPQCLSRFEINERKIDDQKQDFKENKNKVDGKFCDFQVRVETIESVVKTGVNDMRLKTELIHEDFINVSKKVDDMSLKFSIMHEFNNRLDKEHALLKQDMENKFKNVEDSLKKIEKRKEN